MTIDVPRVQASDIRPHASQLPGDNEIPDLDAGAKGLQQFGETITGAGSQLAQVGARLQHEDEQREVQARMLGFRQTLNDYTYGNKEKGLPGWKNLTGQQYIEYEKALRGGLKKASRELSAQITNPVVLQAVKERTAIKREEMYSAYAEGSIEQRTVAKQVTRLADIEFTKKEAALQPFKVNPDGTLDFTSTDQKIFQVTDQVAQLANTANLSKPRYEGLLELHISQLIAGAVDTRLAGDNPDVVGAKALFERYKSMLDIDTRNKLDNSIASSKIDATVQSIVKEAMSEGTPKERRDEGIRLSRLPGVSPDVEEKVLLSIRKRNADEARDKATAEADAVEFADKWVADKKNPNDLPKHIRDLVKQSGHFPQLLKDFTSILNNVSLNPDPKFSDRMWDTVYNNPEQAKNIKIFDPKVKAAAANEWTDLKIAVLGLRKDDVTAQKALAKEDKERVRKSQLLAPMMVAAKDRMEEANYKAKDRVILRRGLGEIVADIVRQNPNVKFSELDVDKLIEDAMDIVERKGELFYDPDITKAQLATDNLLGKAVYDNLEEFYEKTSIQEDIPLARVQTIGEYRRKHNLSLTSVAIRLDNERILKLEAQKKVVDAVRKGPPVVVVPEPTPDVVLAPEVSFDAEGDGFDDATAKAHGLKRDATGHLGSVVPVTEAQIAELGVPEGSFMLLKGKKHPTFDKAVAAEEARGFKVQKIGDRYFSIPISDVSFEPSEETDAEVAAVEALGATKAEVAAVKTATMDITPVVVAPKLTAAQNREAEEKALKRALAKERLGETVSVPQLQAMINEEQKKAQANLDAEAKAEAVRAKVIEDFKKVNKAFTKRLQKHLEESEGASEAKQKKIKADRDKALEDFKKVNKAFTERLQKHLKGGKATTALAVRLKKKTPVSPRTKLTQTELAEVDTVVEKAKQTTIATVKAGLAVSEGASGSSITGDKKTLKWGLTQERKDEMIAKAGRELSDDEAINMVLEEDYKIVSEGIPGFLLLPEVAQVAILDMTYNIGNKWVTAIGFNLLKTQIKEGNLIRAMKETLDTANVGKPAQSMKGIAKRRAEKYNDAISGDQKIVSVKQFDNGRIRYTFQDGGFKEYTPSGGKHPDSKAGTVSI